MVSVGCRIHTHPARTDPGLVERFRNIPVANLDDCMGRTAALSSAIRPYGPRRRAAAPQKTPVPVMQPGEIRLHPQRPLRAVHHLGGQALVKLRLMADEENGALIFL